MINSLEPRVRQIIDKIIWFFVGRNEDKAIVVDAARITSTKLKALPESTIEKKSLSRIQDSPKANRHSYEPVSAKRSRITSVRLAALAKHLDC